MSLITDNFLEAIDIIVDKKISEAAYDKAVVAEIKAVVDKDKGIYQVKYQDSSFTAISIGDVEYRVGHQVYVLTPNNDLTQERIILGKTSGSRGDKYADKVIGNSIMKGFTFSTKADNIDIEGSIEQVLYDYNKPQEAKIIAALDQAALAEYVHRASSLLVSASFTSKVAEDDLKQGDYGFIIEAQFENKIETFTFNKTQLGVDLFNFSTPTLKSALFSNIDGQQFKRINKITWFVKDVKQGAVIIFNDLQIYGCTDTIGLNEVGAKLELKAPSGTIFESLTGNNSQELMTLPIQARLRNGDKYISDPNIEYSFYVETPWIEKGWMQIDAGDINNPDRTLSNTDFTSYYQHLKCEAKRGGEVYSEQLLFQNTIIDSGWITIERQDDKSICSLTAKLVNENGKVDENTSLDGLCSWMTIGADGAHTKLDNTSATLSIDLNALDGDVTYVVGVESKDKAVARYSIILAQETVIKDAIHYYAKSTKDTEVPQSGWSKNKPTSYAGYYLWDKVIYYYTDGSTLESDPMITGTSVSVALYAYGNIQEPGSDNDITGWSTEPLPVSEQQGKQEVYVTYGFNVNGAYLVGQDWTEPILYARYAADGAISIYRYAYQKVKYETTLSKPEKNWSALEPTDTPEVWCQVAVDLNKDYPFVYQCMQEEINKDGKISYGEWSAPFLDRHWGEDYIYGYSYDETSELPTISNGNVSWGSWSSADLPLDDLHPYVYRITGIIEGNVMQPLDDDMGGNGWWTSPVLYKNKSLNLTLTNTQYAVADSGNFTAEGNPPVEDDAWNDVYPDLNDNAIKGKYIWTKIIYSDGSIHYEVSYVAHDGEPGSSGADAKDLVLKVDSLYAKQDRDNKISPSSITFTAVTQNIEPTGYIWKLNGATQSASGVVFKIEDIDASLFTNDIFSVSVQPKDSALSQYTDSVSISLLKDGNDAFSIINSNPSMIFNATDNNDVSENATIELWRGLEQINDFTISGHGVNGHTITIAKSDVVPNEGESTVTFDYTISAISESYNFNSSFQIICTLVRDGDSVKDLTVHTTAFVVKKLGKDQFDPETVTFSATVNGFNEIPTINWLPEQYNGMVFSKVLFKDGATKSVDVTASTIVDGIEYKDTTTVVLVEDGKDAYTVANSNPVMVFNEKDDDTTPETATLIVYRGIKKVKEQQVTYTKGSGAGVHTIDLSVTDEEGKTIPLSTTITVKIVKDGVDGQDGKPGDPGPKGDTITSEEESLYWGGKDINSEPSGKPDEPGSTGWDEYKNVSTKDNLVIYISKKTVVKVNGEEDKTKSSGWSDPALYRVNGSNADVTLVNTFNALTNNGKYKGIFYSEDGKTIIPVNKVDVNNEDIKLFINADMIKTGALSVGGDNNTQFYASMNGGPVRIGGFHVTENSFYSGKSSLDSFEAGVYLGINGIHIGQDDDSYFKATKQGDIAISGHIVAKSGNIGGLKILRDTYGNQAGLSYDILDGDGTELPIFALRPDGTALFNGEIQAIAGNIGGLAIDAEDSKSLSYTGNDGVVFSVNDTGASITGEVNATSGSFGKNKELKIDDNGNLTLGLFNVSNDGLKYEGLSILTYGNGNTTVKSDTAEFGTAQLGKDSEVGYWVFDNAGGLSFTPNSPDTLSFRMDYDGVASSGSGATWKQIIEMASGSMNFDSFTANSATIGSTDQKIQFVTDTDINPNDYIPDTVDQIKMGLLTITPTSVGFDGQISSWSQIIAKATAEGYLTDKDAEKKYLQIKNYRSDDRVAEIANACIANANLVNPENFETYFDSTLTNKDDDYFDKQGIATRSSVEAHAYSKTETNNKINEALQNYYTKQEIADYTISPNEFNTEIAQYYTKTQTNEEINKAVQNIDLSQYYKKTEIYTKNETESLILNSVGYVLNTQVTV